MTLNDHFVDNFADPSGTTGPQMKPYYQHQSGESFTTTKPGSKEDNVPPPKIAPPVFLSVPPPPPNPTNQNAPVPPMRSRNGPPFGGPPRRNAPMRSHSMSVADVNRFYGSPPLPRFRPPPPPNARGVEISELGGGNDSGSDNELQDEMQRHRKPKKHFIHHHNQVLKITIYDKEQRVKYFLRWKKQLAFENL